jgi:hypothetical protein
LRRRLPAGALCLLPPHANGLRPSTQACRNLAGRAAPASRACVASWTRQDSLAGRGLVDTAVNTASTLTAGRPSPSDWSGQSGAPGVLEMPNEIAASLAAQPSHRPLKSNLLICPFAGCCYQRTSRTDKPCRSVSPQVRGSTRRKCRGAPSREQFEKFLSQGHHRGWSLLPSAHHPSTCPLLTTHDNLRCVPWAGIHAVVPCWNQGDSSRLPAADAAARPSTARRGRSSANTSRLVIDGQARAMSPPPRIGRPK